MAMRPKAIFRGGRWRVRQGLGCRETHGESLGHLQLIPNWTEFLGTNVFGAQQREVLMRSCYAIAPESESIPFDRQSAS
jgi:hypothetical protein